MSTSEYGPDVELRHETIGAGPSFREVIVERVCPSCGVDWRKPGSTRLGHQVGREVLCWGCMRFHRARLKTPRTRRDQS